jgi:DNA polymerase/3'-5' exonuclease PolX
VIELLTERLYEMELNAEPDHRLWMYCKAAWEIEDMAEDIGLVYRAMGLKGLQAIPGVGQPMETVVEGMLAEAKTGGES